jgi:hypothetical protein
MTGSTVQTAERQNASERMKKRAIKLVNNDFLMSMLNKP